MIKLTNYYPLYENFNNEGKLNEIFGLFKGRAKNRMIAKIGQIADDYYRAIKDETEAKINMSNEKNSREFKMMTSSSRALRLQLLTSRVETATKHAEEFRTLASTMMETYADDPEFKQKCMTIMQEARERAYRDLKTELDNMLNKKEAIELRSATEDEDDYDLIYVEDDIDKELSEKDSAWYKKYRPMFGNLINNVRRIRPELFKKYKAKSDAELGQFLFNLNDEDDRFRETYANMFNLKGRDFVIINGVKSNFFFRLPSGRIYAYFKR